MKFKINPQMINRNGTLCDYSGNLITVYATKEAAIEAAKLLVEQGGRTFVITQDVAIVKVPTTVEEIP